MNRLKWTLLILLVIAGGVFAQRRGGFGGGYYGGRGERNEGYETAREMPQHTYDENGELQLTPMWTNTAGFEKDAFTFARIKRNRGGWGGGGSWDTDAPDSDLNLSWRLSTLTALKVNPEGRFIRLTDKELSNYPFLYMVEPGTLALEEDEVPALRKYLLNGGFVWLDDFWGESEWNSMAEQFKRVFPDRKWEELPLDHQIYHCVFDIKSKEQVPTVERGSARQFNPDSPTWENGGREVHHRAIFDDKRRIMVLATHNTDNGDGWEWEGNNHFYFANYAEKTAYPLAINVIFYTMTH